MKKIIITIGLIFLILGGCLAFVPFKMHKPFQISIIEYIIKINTDNSITKTKKVTDYKVIEENQK